MLLVRNARRERQTRFCGLRRFPHSGLRAPVPDVAGSEPLVEEFLLDGGAGLLEQGSKVPEHAHIEHARTSSWCAS